MNQPPRISCLTVTKDGRRFELLTRSIRCFQRQTWPNRELIIISDGSPAYARRIDDWLVRYRGRDEIVHHYIPGERRLGCARNLSVAHARGPYLCQWDDDDLNHPERLRIQFEHMRQQGAPASLMEDQLQYFYDSGELLWISWRPDLIPGTLMCRKECLERHPYLSLARGEDACIREILRERGDLALLRGMGYLSMYTYSGLNVYPRRHHRQIRFTHDPGYVNERVDILRRELDGYDLDLSGARIVGDAGTVPLRASWRLIRSLRLRIHRTRNRWLTGRRPAPEG